MFPLAQAIHLSKPRFAHYSTSKQVLLMAASVAGPLAIALPIVWFRSRQTIAVRADGEKLRFRNFLLCFAHDGFLGSLTVTIPIEQVSRLERTRHDDLRIVTERSAVVISRVYRNFDELEAWLSDLCCDRLSSSDLS
ncbi:MAG: hypothetical protein AAF297_11800 [Planctomycetota bacterium]